MEAVQLILHNIFSFILIISLIVFVHEFGHFFVARLCGVKVDEFAIGFGKKIFGFKDKKGTKWKFCLWPFGGYVKMYGDRNSASMPDFAEVKKMSAAEKKISFVGKNVYQRIAIVAAGPIANFILAIFIFTFLFRINGLNSVLPIVENVLPQSPAFEAGIKKDDKILKIDGKEILDFEEIRLATIDESRVDLIFEVERDKKIFELKITPKIQPRKDFFGDDINIRTLGISASQVNHRNLNLSQSFILANKETYKISKAILKTLGELLVGKRSVKELGGPVKIAQYSGKTVSMGFFAILWFSAMISINLGVMNLLPIPVLDGGHLFYYLIEAIRGKAISYKIQQFGFKLGLSLVLSLMVFTTINDILNLFK